MGLIESYKLLPLLEGKMKTLLGTCESAAGNCLFFSSLKSKGTVAKQL